MKPVCVLGAGMTGLAAARELEAAGAPVRLFEREDVPGGVCGSLCEAGFTFDATGHLFHASRPETEAYLEDLGLWEKMVRHERRAAVWIDRHQTPYPIQINTWGLAPETRRDCLLGFIRAWAAGGGEPENFRQWVLDRFGEGLAKHFFFPYNEKLYRIGCEDLSLDWVGRYVPRPDLEEVVDGALGLHRGGAGYNAHFHYPREGGIRLLPDTMASRCRSLELGAEVRAIHLGQKWLELGSGERVEYSALIATNGLPAICDLLLDELPKEIAAARRALRWIRVLNVALGVEGEAPTDQHWLYFPDPELPFYRVGFPSNHGRLAPEGCHTVSIEVSMDPGSGEVEKEALAAEEALADIGLLQPGRIRSRVIQLIDPAYVVYDHHRREALEQLLPWLRRHNLFPSGRWAEWKYSAMEDAIADGRKSASAVLELPGS